MVSGVFSIKQEPEGWRYRLKVGSEEIGGGPYPAELSCILGLLYQLSRLMVKAQ